MSELERLRSELLKRHLAELDKPAFDVLRAELERSFAGGEASEPAEPDAPGT